MVFVKVTWQCSTKWKPGFLSVDQLLLERYGIWILTFSSPTTSLPALGPTQSHIQWLPGYPRGGNRKSVVNLTTHCHEVPRLRMNGATVLLFLYDFVAYVGTTVYFALILYLRISQLSVTLGLCVRVIRSWDLTDFRSPFG
jgi:hypothetical protein